MDVAIIEGTVRANEPGAGALRVVATADAKPGWRSEATVGARGEFVIHGDLAELAEGRRVVSLVVRVRAEAEVLTRAQVEVDAVRAEPARVQLTVPPLRGRRGVWVGGRLIDRDGTGLGEHIAVVERLDLEGARAITRARTESDGTWQVRVPAEASLDLRVVIGRGEEVVVVSDVFFDVANELYLASSTDAVAPPATGRQRMLQGRDAELVPVGRQPSLSDDAIEVLAHRVDAEIDEVRAVLDARALEADDPDLAEAAFALRERNVLRGAGAFLSIGAAQAERELEQAIVRGDAIALRGTVPEVIGRLRTHAAAAFADTAEGHRRRGWLAAIGLDDDASAEVVRRLALDEWRTPAQREALREAIGPRQARRVEIALDLHEIGIGHDAVVRRLADRDAAGDVVTLRELAKWSVDDWGRLLAATPGQPPITAPDLDEDADGTPAYARRLASAVEAAEPTVAVAHHWSRISGDPSVAAFVDLNPEFDLLATNAVAVLDRGEAMVPEGADATVLASELRVVQRLATIAPAGRRGEVLERLRSLGARSATAVVDMGWRALSTRSGLPSDVAAKVFASAQHKHALATALVLRHTDSLENHAIASYVGSRVGNLETLFGPLRNCACEHCRSVLSPAAYLADLLTYLRRVAGDTESLLDRLVAKGRADAIHVDLDCANTHTPLPYIDLVNEKLEAVVAHGDANVGASSRQTTWGADRLRSHPEHLDVRAYEVLRDVAVHPFGLPFDLFAGEVDAYLGKLGIGWSALLRGLADDSDRSRDAAAAAEIGLVPEQARIVAGERDASTLDMWGVSTLQDLSSVPTLLDHAGIDLPALQALLRTWFVSRPATALAGELSLAIDLAEPCRLDGATVVGVPDGAAARTALWDRAHRFLRLHAATGWSIEAVDLATRNLAGIDRSFFARLADAQRVHARLPSVSRVRLLSLWGNVQTRRGPDRAPSLYDASFGEVLGSLGDDDDTPDAGVGLDNAQARLRAVFSRVAVGLRISDEQLHHLQAALDIDDAAFVTVALLSRLLAHVTLAHALGETPAAIARYRHVVGIDPLADPASTLRWLDARAGIRTAGTLDAARYVALGELDPSAPTDADLAEIVMVAIDGLRAAEDLVPSDGSGSERLQAALVMLLAPEETSAVIAAVAALASRGTTNPPATDDDSVSPQQVLTEWLGPWVSSPNALADALAVASEPDTLAAALADLLEPAASVARRRAVVRATLSDGLGHPAELVDLLLPRIAVDETTTLLDALSTLDLDGSSEAPDPSEMDAAAVARLSPGLRRLDRGGRAVALLRLDADRTSWWLSHADELGLLPVDDLPATWGDHAAERFVRSLVVATELAAAPGAADVFADAAARGAADPVDGDLAETIASVIGPWLDGAEVTSLALVRGLTSGDVATGSGLARLRDAAKLLRSTGLSLEVVQPWLEDGLSAETAAAVKQWVTVRIDEARRGDELGPLRDVLRKKQRDALVARVVSTDPGLADADGIIDAYLIDAQINPCRKASRVQQAIAAAQLMVQRAQLGLEGQVEFSEAERQEWEWMRSYRVWEANRKVFLWPENWLEPRLRLDKTHLFDPIANQLSGVQLDDAAAEDAARSYLTGLREVSRLRIGGVGWERRPGVERLHLFGCTRNAQRQWFHRVRDAGMWSPWRAVPLQIEADDVLLFEERGQLVAAWPSYTVQEHPNGDPRPTVELNWSRLRAGEWEPASKTGPHGLARNSINHHWEDQSVDVRDGRIVSLEALVDDDARAVEIIPLVWRGPVRKTLVELPRFDAVTCGDTFVTRKVDQGHYQTSAKRDGVSFPFAFEPAGQGARFALDSAKSWMTLWVVVPQADNVLWASTVVSSPRRPSIQFPRARRASLGAPPVGLRVNVPILYQDALASLVIPPVNELHGADDDPRVELHQHPFVCEMLEAEHHDGVAGLYRPGPESDLHRQRKVAGIDVIFNDVRVVHPPVAEFDFRVGSSFGEYNWELFLHLPLAIAKGLADRGRFEDAKRWLERIFDPLGGDADMGSGGDVLGAPGVPDSAARYWMIKPLWETGRPSAIEDDLELLGASNLSAAEARRRDELLLQVQQMRQHPFEPHRIARLRPGAYQRQVVLAYLDVLFAWGDSRFARATTEGIDEALQLYLLAASILGPRPTPVPAQTVPSRSYDELSASLDAFGNLFVEIEEYIPWGVVTPKAGGFGPSDTDPGGSGLATPHPAPPQPPGNLGAVLAPPLNPFAIDDAALGAFPSAPLDPRVFELVPLSTVRQMYFCIPPNERWDAYWDRLEDRLFKIRNCLGLDGGALVPDLFAPPIDPATLVEAIANGVDLASAIDDLYAPLPHYRFRTALALARELAGQVRELGRGVLSALERRDAEEFSRLGNAQERAVLSLQRQVLVTRIDEAREAITTLTAAKATAHARREHYAQLLETGALRPEEDQLGQLRSAKALERRAGWFRFGVEVYNNSPMWNAQWGGKYPDSHWNWGMSQLANAGEAVSEAYSIQAREADRDAARHAVVASQMRRDQDWVLQREQAELEVARIEREIATAQIRVQVAERELKVHDRTTDNNLQTKQFLQSKYTGEELFDWLVGQTTQVHRVAFELALDLARKAQRAMRFELADPEATFVEGAYWDDRHAGLLAAERLLVDLSRMEAAYVENDKREHELIKRVSLAQVAPLELMRLRFTGECEIDVDEAQFQLDHPSHYLRRIRRVAVTVPAVAGPAVGVTGTLSLERSAVRPRPESLDDDPIVDFAGGTQSIAISTGLEDTGTFSEGRGDDRRLPFEGKGAISRWRLTLPELRQFDYRSISDVILRIEYTARDAGGALAAQVTDRIRQALTASGSGEGDAFVPGARLRVWSARADFPDAWQAFRNGPDAGQLALTLGEQHFPLLLEAGATRTVGRVEVFVETEAGVGDVTITAPNAAIAAQGTTASSQLPGTQHGAGPTPSPVDPIGTWTIALPDVVDPSTITDIHVLMHYGIGGHAPG